jgi:hypothetical protein
MQLTVNIVGAGALLTCAVSLYHHLPETRTGEAYHHETRSSCSSRQVCLFDWPFYNKHPINFTASKRGKLSVVRE